MSEDLARRELTDRLRIACALLRYRFVDLMSVCPLLADYCCRSATATLLGSTGIGKVRKSGPSGQKLQGCLQTGVTQLQEKMASKFVPI